VTHDRLLRISRTWKSMFDTKVIAERFGYKSRQSAADSITAFRRRYPDLFPYKPSDKVTATARKRNLIKKKNVRRIHRNNQS
jgi:tRNA splicing ligase